MQHTLIPDKHSLIQAIHTISQEERATTARARPYTTHHRPASAESRPLILDAEDYIRDCLPATDDSNTYIESWLKIMSGLMTEGEGVMKKILRRLLFQCIALSRTLRFCSGRQVLCELKGGIY